MSLAYTQVQLMVAFVSMYWPPDLVKHPAVARLVQGLLIDVDLDNEAVC